MKKAMISVGQNVNENIVEEPEEDDDPKHGDLVLNFHRPR